MNFRLETFSGFNCTIGKWYEGTKLLCCTIEKEWKNNKKGISCIPAGVYDLKPRFSPSKGATYYFENVNKGVSLDDESMRTYIQIDQANCASDLNGCVAVGKGFAIIKGEWAVTSSKATRNKLLDHLTGDEHTIEIIRI